MAAPNALQSTIKLYHSVIDEVVVNVKEAFLDEGVDDAVLHELKQIWKSKVLATKAIDSLDPSQVLASGQSANSSHLEYPSTSHRVVQQIQLDARILPKTGKSFEPFRHTLDYNPNVARSGPTVHQVPSGFYSTDGLNTTPISSLVRSLPQQSVITNAPNGMYMQHMSGMQQNLQGHSANGFFPNTLTSPQLMMSSGRGRVDKRTDIRPLAYNATIHGPSVIVAPPHQLQSYGNRADFSANQNAGATSNSRQANQQQKVVVQLDGPVVMSDDDDEDSTEEEEDVELNVDSLSEAPPTVSTNEGDALNSEDDEVSNENADEMFEADDVVVCQFEKVSRIRNKWKFILKDGIINLGRKDYVFNKALGEAEF